uniref:hypothetical protein n=1 Tax=Gemmiger formicilis TaxID=745368 RepID=UPI003FEFB8F8
AAAGAVLKPPGGNCAVLPLYSVFIVVQGRRFVNGKTGFPRGKGAESPLHLFLALILQTRYNKIEYL